MGAGEFLVIRVPRKRGVQRDTARFKEPLQLEGVAADIVFAQHIHPKVALFLEIHEPDHVGKYLVIGYVMSGRLAHAFISLATETEYVDVGIFRLHFAGHRMNVVADEPHRAG